MSSSPTGSKPEIGTTKFWNEKYRSFTEEGSGDLFGEKPATILLQNDDLFREIAASAGPHGTVRVLELGSGQGRNGIYLCQKYAFSVTALDISDEALKRANEQAAAVLGPSQELYSAQFGDFLGTDLGENKYDLILALFVQATPQHAALHEKICTALKPGGYVVLQGFTPKQIEYVQTLGSSGGPPFKENLYDANDLRTAFASLRIVRCEEHDEQMEHAGIFRGLCALVDLVAQKPPLQ